MTDFEPNDSVRKEQFGNAENTNDTMNEKEGKKEQPQEQENQLNEASSPEEKTKAEDISNEENETLKEPVQEETVVAESVLTESSMEEIDEENEEKTVEQEEAEKSSMTEVEEGNEYELSAEKEVEQDVVSEVESINEDQTTASEEQEDIVGKSSEEAEEKTEEAQIADETTYVQKEEVAVSETKKNEEKVPEPRIDFNKLTQDQLVNTFEILLQSKDIDDSKNDLEVIKALFYKNHRNELDKKKAKFIEGGGNEEEYQVEPSPLENRLKDLLIIYREKREGLQQQIELGKEDNLKKKYEIIDAIRELVNSQESLNKTFHEFRDLQEQWRSVGPVSQNHVKELWEKYHFQVEAFYDYIKINKELRDLDFKKNLEAKIKLCEKAEELLIEPAVVEAFRGLQVLHDQWREIGPVPPEKRAEIWDRFKEATTQINKRHQEYFVNLKQEQKKNLEEKTVLCEKAEEVAGFECSTAKEWDEKSKEIIELQKVWKTIGFAPKKYNAKIYERFRAACDKFFNTKRDFFNQNKEEQQNNFQIKTELCIQAEALKDSTDWKKTTEELIHLQKKWKEIGPVSSKQSDKIWKRFRAACDEFFNNKAHFYKNIDSEYDDNLKEKEDLIKEIEDFVFTDNVQANLEALKLFQRRYSEIGFVPIKKKDEVQKKFRETINKRFDQLRIDEGQKSMLKFKTRIDNIANKPNSDRRLDAERDKCVNKIQQLKNDIALWENNIGFFANSKNAEQMIKDVENKIASAKEKIKSLKERVRLIDQTE